MRRLGIVYIWASIFALTLYNQYTQDMFSFILGGFLTWFWLNRLFPKKLDWGKMGEEERKARGRIHYLERQIEYEKEKLKNCERNSL